MRPCASTAVAQGHLVQGERFKALGYGGFLLTASLDMPPVVVCLLGMPLTLWSHPFVIIVMLLVMGILSGTHPTAKGSPSYDRALVASWVSRGPGACPSHCL